MGVLFLGVIAWGAHSATMPPVVTFAYGVMSLVAMRLYHIDKFAAVNDEWRTRESTLHIVGLLGGWPGALFAQDLYRHKSKKLKFQHFFLLTVLLNCAGLAWLIASGWEFRLPVEQWLDWFAAQDWGKVISVEPGLPVEPDLPRITPLNHAW